MHVDIESVATNDADPTQQLLTVVPHGASQAIVDVDELEPVPSPPAESTGAGAGDNVHTD